MGIGCWLSFLTKYDRYCRDHKCSESIGIINRPGTNNSQSNSATSANTAIESLFKLMQQCRNSGGHTNGELIGINSAIASQTGSYAGYSFAIPVG
jgi:S1-C subfamily serine protease